MKVINDKYIDLYDIKKQSYGILDNKNPVAVFMDGINITKNHESYYMPDEQFTKTTFRCADKIACQMKVPCTVYAGIDEVSFIFHDAERLIKYFNMEQSLSCIQAVFLQNFMKLFWGYYPEVKFKMVMFNIPKEEAGRWVKYRRELCQSIAAVYLAKEHLERERWADMDNPDDVINLLKETGYYQILKDKTVFGNGILREYYSDVATEGFFK